MNEDFLIEFNFFKNNIKEYEQKYPNLIPMTLLITALSVVIMFMLAANEIVNVIYLVVLLVTSGIFCLAAMIFVENKNQRKSDFNYKVYKGSLKELFDDINHPAITSRKERLKDVFEYKKGFTGNIVFEIYLDILNGDAIKNQKELEKEESIMHELNMIK